MPMNEVLTTALQAVRMSRLAGGPGCWVCGCACRSSRWHMDLCSAHKQRVMRALGACAEALQLCPPREEGDNTHKSQHGDAPVAQVDRAVDS